MKGEKNFSFFVVLSSAIGKSNFLASPKFDGRGKSSPNPNANGFNQSRTGGNYNKPHTTESQKKEPHYTENFAYTVQI